MQLPHSEVASMCHGQLGNRMLHQTLVWTLVQSCLVPHSSLGLVWNSRTLLQLLAKKLRRRCNCTLKAKHKERLCSHHIPLPMRIQLPQLRSVKERQRTSQRRYLDVSSNPDKWAILLLLHQTLVSDPQVRSCPYAYGKSEAEAKANVNAQVPTPPAEEQAKRKDMPRLIQPADKHVPARFKAEEQDEKSPTSYL
ncbi:hypothetical protein ACROYT_G017354 [Oculina patagonica]